GWACENPPKDIPQSAHTQPILPASRRECERQVAFPAVETTDIAGFSFSWHTYQPRKDSSLGASLFLHLPIYLMDEASHYWVSATYPVRRSPHERIPTMLAIHDQFTRQMRNRLETTAIGLGLVRLLQDAKRFDEAKTILYSLENEFQDASERPSKKPCKMKGVIKTASCSSTRAAAEMRPHVLSLV